MFLLYPLKVSIPQIGLLGLSAKVKKKKKLFNAIFSCTAWKNRYYSEIFRDNCILCLQSFAFILGNGKYVIYNDHYVNDLVHLMPNYFFFNSRILHMHKLSNFFILYLKICACFYKIL